MRQSSLLRDVASTSAVQLLSVLMNAVSLAVIARRLGDASLGFYTLERRSMALLQPLVLLGLTVAVPRYVAAQGDDDARARGAFASGGLIVVLVVSATVATIMLLVPETVAAIAFGGREAAGLARALAAFVFAMAAYQVVYCAFRGWMMVAWANALELLAVGALPLAVALAGPRAVDDLVWVLSAAILAVTVAFAVAGLGRRLKAPAATIAARIPTLLRFGLARTPGDLAVVALFSLAPVVVVHAADPTQAGYASIVLSSLNLVSVAAVPLSTLLLPRAAADHAAGLAEQSEKYRLLWGATLDAAIGVCGVLLVASPLVMTLWLSSASDELVLAQQIAALGVPGYIVYLVFRSFLDATHERPYSSIATLAGLAVLGVGLAAGLLLDADALQLAAGATAAGLTTTGVLIWRFTARGLAVRRLDRATRWLCGWLVLCAATSAVIGNATGAAIAGALLVTGAYIGVLAVLRPPWATTLVARLRDRPGAPA